MNIPPGRAEVTRMMRGAAATSIAGDESLLDSMLEDAARQKDLYRPGPYWLQKTRNTAAQIRRHGLSDFRGASSTIGVSFTDSVYLDVRHDLSSGLRSILRVLLNSVYPLNKMFDVQTALTGSYAAEVRRLRGMLLGASQRVRELVERYNVPPSLLAGCLDYVEIDGRRIATHYLNVLHQHDVLARSSQFSDIVSMLEIGGGFGSHVHCLIENYSKLRKVVYLDVPPNLYVGTQYLRAFYGDAVIDYRQTRELQEIGFSHSDKLEILAVAPWQIERLRASIDLLYNAYSFVEMPAPVIGNYARHISALPGFEHTCVMMLTYNNFDPGTTLDPNRLPEFFPTKTFNRQEFSTLDSSFGVISFVSRNEPAQ